ncbi:hypothetical protein H6504_01265 [Candidatus Woesearchaeota archaeon]|nr:hypothetical protein [Candidatus Woesearchaeota archaeon]
MTPRTLLFVLGCFLITVHYALIFASAHMHIDEDYIERSHELLKYVIAAWIGSVIGG